MDIFSEIKSFYFGVRRLRVLSRKLSPSENPNYEKLSRAEINSLYDEFVMVRSFTCQHLNNIHVYLLENGYVSVEYLER
jgi:hypothetical protein